MLLPMPSLINLLVGNQDLETADNLCEGNAGVLLPVLESLGAVDEDNEVFGLALVVDLGLLSVATSHVDCMCRLGVEKEVGNVFRESQRVVKAE